MLEIYLTVAFSVLNIALPYAIVRYDRSRLGDAERARGWNQASFACAVYFFGPFSLPAHFWVTRRRPLALLVGALLAIFVLGVEWAIGALLESVLT